MAAITKEISVNDIEEGMHIVALDRPWHQTPFPIQGFYVKEDGDIQALRFYCKTVFIETEENRENYIEDLATDRSKKKDQDNPEDKILKIPDIRITKKYRYERKESFSSEILKAKDIVNDVSKSMSSILTEIRQGKGVNFQALGNCAEEMTESVIRNPDALLFLSRIKNKDSHTYSHSLKAAVWAMIIARSYELGPESIKNIGKSALLCKIGRMAVLDQLKEKTQRTPEGDLALYQTYPLVGASILEGSKLHSIVIDGIKYHRERHNGSGFPSRITGEKIPLNAKIVGIADYYEFLVEHRSGRHGMTPSAAASHLFKNRDMLFQGDLVDKLIQTIGIYPVGSNVVLSDGRVGVIIAIDTNYKLYPTLKIVRDKDGIPLESGPELNLLKLNEKLDKPITISQCLPFYSVEVPIDLDQMGDETVTLLENAGIYSEFKEWMSSLIHSFSGRLKKPTG